MHGDDGTASALVFFNEHEARTVDAIAARLVPGDQNDPGAREAGAVVYLDRTLGGFLRNLQAFYRRALTRFDELCVVRYGALFADLQNYDQDRVLSELEAAGRGGEGASEVRDVSWTDEGLLATFFEVVREHLLQGMFCDPVYGGNRDLAGWRLLGFPGVQWGYTPEQMQPGVDWRSIPMRTLADLRRERPWGGEQ